MAFVAGVLVLGFAGPALADAGPQRFVLTFSGPLARALANDPGRRVIASGVITGVGEEEFLSQGPGPSPGTFVGASNFVFPEGTVGVEVEGTVAEQHFGPGGCFLRNTISGSFTITGGTGAFAGATGGGTFTGVNLVFGSVSDGGCSADDARLVSSVRLTGTIDVPDQAAA